MLLEFDDDGNPLRRPFAVDFTERADRDAIEAAEWYAKRSRTFAARWYVGLHSAVAGLAVQPFSEPVAVGLMYNELAVRRMLYTNGRTSFYVYYSVAEPDTARELGIIQILRVRNAVMRPLRQAQVEESQESDEH